MKNALKFGLLGVLAVMPWALGLVIDSWSGRIFTRSLLMRRSDAVMYGYIDRALPYITDQVMLYVLMLCWALALVSAIIALYLAWRTHPLSGKSRGVLWAEIFGRAAVLAAVAIAGARFGLGQFYMYPEEGVALFLTSFGGALGPLVRYSFPVLQLASYAFALCVVTYSAFISRSFGVFAGRALAGAGSMLAVFFCLGAAADYLDMGRYLDEIPGMSGQPEPRTLVVLNETPMAMPLDTSFNDCSVSETFCRKVPSSSSNEEAVRDYLEKRGYRTALRGPALSFIALNRLRELDSAGAMSAFEQALDVTGDITQGMSVVARLVYSPVTGPYHEILDELSDETRFAATGRTALRLSRAYAAFGELDKAQYWFDRGVEDLGSLDETDMEYFRLPDRQPFSGGTICGRISLDGEPAAGVRVGLVRESVAARITNVHVTNNRDILPFYDLQWITDGTATDLDGLFRFEGLSEGGYVLMLSLNDAAGAGHHVETGPGLIRVSESAPSVDVGTVSLALTAH